MNLYLRLAKINIKNGKQFYLPYILTGILNVAVLYLVLYIATNSGVSKIIGAQYLQSMLIFGSIVMTVFSFIFIYYTNSFIMKRRKKEIGIYNILGMEKRHIGRVLAVEGLFSALVCIIGGLAFGILFSRFMTMLLYKIIRTNESIVFEISKTGIITVLIVFSMIFLSTYVYNIVQINHAKPIELISGGNVGEREPKTKIFMTIAGVLCMAGGYYISITTVNPVQAVLLFFVAVLLVIIGTYLLFTTGSITVLKLLRKNKKFYYTSRHFAAVSGMIYRMKQNAVGLGNICILSTMVLVTASATFCLYLGIEDIMNKMYPHEITVEKYYEASEYTEEKVEKLEDFINQTIEEKGRKIEDYTGFTYTWAGEREGNDGELRETQAKIMYAEGIFYYSDSLAFDMSRLKDNEAYIIGYPKYEDRTITLDGVRLNIVGSVKEHISDDYLFEEVGEEYVILTSDMDVLLQVAQGRTIKRLIYVDIDGSSREKIECAEALKAGDDNLFSRIIAKAEYESEYYILYGGLLFIGLFFGIMFLMATVLIIYYKQISEGYVDKGRFEIMRKVGMNDSEIKASISSQIRMVFFLPLATAGIHMFGAFPIVSRCLYIFSFTNTRLFIYCLFGTLLVFAVIYYIVFKITSRSYYKIVGHSI